MAKKRIIILGAGLAGLSTAWYLQKKGIDCQIFEKEPEVGGLCRSKNINGFTFDYSGHLLHFKQPSSFNFIKNLLGNNLARHARNACIYSFDRYIRYPFQANLYGLPLPIIKECLLGFIQASLDNHRNKKESINFFNWINQTFGRGIARHFMLPYNTKFWTLPPQQLTCGWLDGLVPVPSLSQVIEGTVRKSQKQLGYNVHFWYPKKEGISQLPLALADGIKHVYTNCSVTEIDIVKREIKINSGDKEKFDYLISAIPLPEIPHIIKDMPKETASLFRRLKWNSIFNLNLGIDREDNSKMHWVYFPEERFCFFRVGFPHRFSSSLAPVNKSSLYVEAAYSKDRPIDKNRIILQIMKELKRTGILFQNDKICAQDINDIKYGYPIYDQNYQQARGGILKYLRQNNILPCGRYGSWRYMSMEDVILEGKIITDKLLGKK